MSKGISMRNIKVHRGCFWLFEDDKLTESKWFMGLVILFYTIVAFKSSGYHNADEHFQIIEFANFKLGKTTASDLAWEFNAKVRPALQPMLCFILFKLLAVFDIQDPYSVAFALRLVTALSMIAAITYFIKAVSQEVPDWTRNFLVLASFFLWFLPYINVRFSSETWSGIFILFSLGFIKRARQSGWTNAPLLLGFTFGVSILFRYQSAVLILGAVGWMVFIGKVKLAFLTRTVIGGVLIVILGVFLDRWLYGVYTCTFYNYFYVNLIQDVASQYGVSPWYQIIIYIITAPGFIGIFVFISLVKIFFVDPRNLILWSIIPFLLVHAVIPHKELRFLFPIANLAPVILTYGVANCKTYLYTLKKRSLLYVFAVIAVLNIPGLYAVASRGAGKGKIAVAEFIHHHYYSKEVNLLYTSGLNPYSDWAFPKNRFYVHPHKYLTEVFNIWKLDSIALNGRMVNLLLVSSEDITGPRTLSMLNEHHYVRVFESLNPVNFTINELYDQELNNRQMILFEYKGE